MSSLLPVAYLYSSNQLIMISHERLKTFVHGKTFCHAVNYVIIAFSAVVGFETFLTGPAWVSFFNVLEFLFLTFFTLEIILRIAAENRPTDFFNLLKTRKLTFEGRRKTKFEITEHGFWNYFDFLLIVMSIIGLFANVFVFPGFLQIGRLFRIFRIVRLLEISEHLKVVEKRIVSIVPTVFSFAVLLVILTYIYSIIGMFMFNKGVYAEADFSSIKDAFITLFQLMTLDNWTDVMRDMRAHEFFFHPFIVEAYFVSFVIFTAIIALNVFIAVMTSQVQEQMEKDIEEKIEEVEIKLPGDKIAAGMNDLLMEIRSLKAEVQELRKRI